MSKVEKPEFETEQALNHFKGLMLASFPRMDPRQYADLMAVFMAGYSMAAFDLKALKVKMSDAGAEMMLDAFAKDAVCRGMWAAKCMVSKDWSDPMFDQSYLPESRQ